MADLIILYDFKNMAEPIVSGYYSDLYGSSKGVMPTGEWIRLEAARLQKLGRVTKINRQGSMIQLLVDDIGKIRHKKG